MSCLFAATIPSPPHTLTVRNVNQLTQEKVTKGELCFVVSRKLTLPVTIGLAVAIQCDSR